MSPSLPTTRGGVAMRAPRDDEHRRRVADAERLEVPEHSLEVVGDLIDRDLGVDPELGLQIFTTQLRASNAR